MQRKEARRRRAIVLGAVSAAALVAALVPFGGSASAATSSGSSSNVNDCTSILRPPISLVPDGTSNVTITIGSDAAPDPHLGAPITLSNSTVTADVPPDLLIQGYNFGILTNGQQIAATLDLTIGGSNTVEGTHAYATIPATATIVIHDPDGTPGTGDETADPLSVTTPLPDTTWTPVDPSLPVVFTEVSAVINAVVPIGDQNYTSTQTCSVTDPTPFVTVSPGSATSSSSSSSSSSSRSSSSSSSSVSSTTASTASTTTSVPSETSTTVAQSCKPGNGYGDKNHCHTGPPGHHKHHGDFGPNHDGDDNHDGHGANHHAESLAMRFVAARTSAPGRAGLVVLLGLATALVAVGGRVPRRRRVA